MYKVILVDIDGTIADASKRVHYLKGPKKNWDSFYEACHLDDPIPEVIDLVKNLMSSYRVIFCTGRRESERQKTWQWLKDHEIYITTCKLLMRKEGDYRPDHVCKPELVKEAHIKNEDIAFVLEDRDSMVKYWRDQGVRCLQVANGDF